MGKRKICFPRRKTNLSHRLSYPGSLMVLLVIRIQFLYINVLSDAGLSLVLQVSVIPTACWEFNLALWPHLHRRPRRHQRPAGHREKPLQGHLGTRQLVRDLLGPCPTAELRRSQATSTTHHMRSWGNTTGEFFIGLIDYFTNRNTTNGSELQKKTQQRK